MPGEWLYHYTSLETALVHILPNLTLRLNPFSEMRDPREYTKWLITRSVQMSNRHATR
jgi:hypothetical protein